MPVSEGKEEIVEKFYGENCFGNSKKESEREKGTGESAIFKQDLINLES